jgi:cellulose synthase operon protein B
VKHASVLSSIDETVAAVRIDGVPALLISDVAARRTGRLIGSPSLAALRDTSTASIRPVSELKITTDRIRFDELGIIPPLAEVFGRAEIAIAVLTRTLPNGKPPSRFVLDIMVAPDGAGENAVVSAFVNERLLASKVASIGDSTRLDIPIPGGLVGTVSNIRLVVQRRSSQGDCRFEPQGYAAEVQGSSTVFLSRAESSVQNFSELIGVWSKGVEVLLPSETATRPLQSLGLLAGVLSNLSTDSSSIEVRYIEPNVAPSPRENFIVVSDVAPSGDTQRVHFDRGRVSVIDRSGRTRLDLGGVSTGAVMQISKVNSLTGLWIKPLTSDGHLQGPVGVKLDQGDVAFVDKTGRCSRDVE